MMFISLKIFVILLALVGCKQRGYNLTEKGSGLTGESGRTDFFDHQKLWYIRLSGWDPSKIQSWQIGDKTKVNGARLDIFRLSQESAEKTWCPNPSEFTEKEKIFTTTEFNVSLRGDKSKGTPKGSYLINFEKENERFLDLKRLHLVAMFNDLSQMREALSQRLFSFMKVPAPRNAYLRFCMDDVYRGLYLNIEEVDNRFVNEVIGKPRFVSIYEGRDGLESDSGQLAPRSGSGTALEKFEGRGYGKISGDADARFQDFEKLLNRIEMNHKSENVSGKLETLTEIFDVDSFIKWMAVNQIIGGWDNYYYNAKNYFLVNSCTLEKPYFHWVTIDLDNSFGVSFTGHDWSKADIFEWEAVKGGSHRLPLVTLMLRRPEWKKKYVAALTDLISLEAPKLNVQEMLFNDIASIWKVIESSVKRESDTEGIDYTRTDPFKMAHTARQFTTSDIRLQVTEDSITAIDPAGWSNMKSPHLRTFIKRKWQSVAEQISRVK